MSRNFSCNHEKCCSSESQMNCTATRYGPSMAKVIGLINFHMILAVLAVFGSYLMIKAFHKFFRLRTESNIILVSLSAADGILAIPLILDAIHRIVDLSPQFQRKHQALCISSAIICFFLISVIILHLALISVERFIAVMWALRYRTIVTNRRAVIACIGMWLWSVAVVFLFPNAMTAGSSDDFDHFRQAIHPCSCSHDGPLDHHHLAPSTKGYLVFLMISLMIIPLMIIAFSYGYTFVVSQRHRKEIRELGDIPRMASIKREMKGTRTLAIVVAICLFSIIPLLVVTCLRFLGVPPKRKYVKFIVFDLARGLNAICNPVIYGWRNKEFRRAFRKLVNCSK